VPKATRSPETIESMTRRAIRASSAMIPPRVYIPVALRRHKLKFVNGRMTKLPTTPADDKVRIAAADPTAFLIAVMQGHPIPSFKLTEGEGDAINVDVVFDVPSMEVRAQVALALSRRVEKPDPQDTEYEARMKQAAQRAEEE